MNCERFAHMLDNYADLSSAEIAELEAHAEMCESCAADLAFMRSILGTVNSLPPIDPPKDFLESVNARLDAELDSEPAIKRFVRHSKPYVYRYGSLAACVAIAAAVGVNAELLMSRMNNDGSDVVIEEKTIVNDARNDSTADGDVTAADIYTAEPAPRAGAVNEASTPAPNAGNTVKPSQTPASPQTAAPVWGASASKRADSTPSVSQSNKNTAAASVPSNRSEAAASVDLPKAQSAPQPSETEQRVVTSTEEPRAEAQPAAVNTEPVYTDAPKQNNTTEAAASQGEAAPSSYVPRGRMIPENHEYAAAPASLPAAEPTEDTSSDEDYSIAYHEMDNFSDNVTAYAPLSSMLSVKAKDAVRVKELIEVFISGAYGEYYMITAEDMNHLLGQFDREGIWYSANIMESGDKISFRVVTVQSE